MKTLEELEASEKQTLTADEVAPYIGCDGHSIRLQAQKDPAALGFPVIVIGRRIYIPREGFVRFCRGQNVEGYGFR